MTAFLIAKLCALMAMATFAPDDDANELIVMLFRALVSVFDALAPLLLVRYFVTLNDAKARLALTVNWCLSEVFLVRLLPLFWGAWRASEFSLEPLALALDTNAVLVVTYVVMALVDLASTRRIRRTPLANRLVGVACALLVAASLSESLLGVWIALGVKVALAGAVYLVIVTNAEK